ncbi:unnamed protein product [Microthlaspi erraticum]|uniref:Uncharacterized protein n=1 Tax=Microthlaspi erraticum TaxID=1685480 RepID=A0A6D2IXG2_9BRAS|nr:unnamed protein product [Microthlaspi erraticum]CAA7036384.1 unnamed protein product [Microthlaspi erraticum]
MLSVPIIAGSSIAPDQAKSTKVNPPQILVSQANYTNVGDSLISAAKPVLEETSIDIAPPTVQTSNIILDYSESPPLETTQLALNSDSPNTIVTVQLESKQPELYLGDNKFASLVSSDVMDLMTPPGKRILRDRPVKPSIKASIWQVKGGGRGNRGRGRGGSG